MSGALVSVIMPTFNRSALIGESLRSVLGQSHANLEVIIVDDGSTDNTGEVVRGICDERVHYIPIPRSGRPAVPRNIGLKQAQGKYVAFIDSDDLWLQGKIERQVTLMEKDSDVDISYGYSMRFDKTGDKNLGKKYLFKRNGYVKNWIIFFNFVPNVTVMARKSFFDEHGLRFNENLLVAEDYDLWVRSAMAGANFRFIEEILGKYRMHDVQISHDVNNEIRHEWLIINQDTVKHNVSKLLHVAAKWKLRMRLVKWQRRLGHGRD